MAKEKLDDKTEKEDHEPFEAFFYKKMKSFRIFNMLAILPKKKILLIEVRSSKIIKNILDDIIENREFLTQFISSYKAKKRCSDII